MTNRKSSIARDEDTAELGAMKLLGGYWLTGYCACDVDVRVSRLQRPRSTLVNADGSFQSGALTVAIVTLLVSATLLAVIQFRYVFPVTTGLVTGSLAVYAYYNHAKWAYIPLILQYVRPK